MDDRTLVLWLNGQAASHPILAVLARVAAQYLILFLPALLVWLWWRRTGDGRRLVLLAGGAALLAFLLNGVLGHIVARPRPFSALAVQLLVAHPERGDSFPSDHAALSSAVAIALWRGGERVWGPIALVMAVVIGVARIMVGVHYPSDIVGGLVVGLVCAVVALWFREPLRPFLDAILPLTPRAMPDQPRGSDLPGKR